MNPCNPPSSRFRIGPWTTAAAALLLTAGALSGQTLPNPSFEADVFNTAPGYISVNSPISGWSATLPDRAGLNPAGGESPFADNGAIPNGVNVAFLQSPGAPGSALGTTITDLTPGQIYKVSFRVNARTGAGAAGWPVVRVGLDDQPILTFNVTNVGGANPYRDAAFTFTATADAHSISFTNDTADDTTVLFDDFAVAAYSAGWSVAPFSDDATIDVDDSRTYTHAYNFGGGSAPTVVINGVTFTGVAGANPGVNDVFRVFGVGSAYGSDDANNVVSAAGASADLMKRFIYGGNPGNIALFGLTPGTENVVTFYTAGWENGIRAQTLSAGDDRLTVNQDAYGNDAGMRISYRYVAPASGYIVLRWSPFWAPSTMHLYGFSNYQLTTPTTPVIARQPRSHVSTPGSAVLFKVVASGEAPLSYTWYKDGNALAETGPILTLANVTAADVGTYEVAVANFSGSVTSTPAALTLGMIANPSFEEELFLNYPGYVSANSIISGWTGSDAARVGLNPTADGQAPFANTGTIPDGTQVALVQSVSGAPTTLATILAGLTPGQRYSLGFRANGRSDQRPTVRAAVDDSLIGEFRSGPMGGTSAYRYLAFDFTPAADSAVLRLTNDAAADTTVLVDDFRLAPSTTGWSYSAWNDDASSGVESGRVYTHAFSFGGGGLALNTVINGVPFVGVPGANPSLPGRFAASGFTGVFGADDNTVTTNGGGSASLARSFVYYSGTIPAEASQSITLSNLVPGVEYEATIYGVGFDAKAYARAATFAVGEDRRTISEDWFDNNNGIRVTYRYVAEAGGTVTLLYDPTERSSSFHTYGFSNYEVSSTNPPTFYQQPESVTVSGGATVTFNAVVGGEQPIALQWQMDGMDLPGETGPTLTLPNVDGFSSGTYTLVASNLHGVVVSDPAVLEVGLVMNNPSFEVDTFATYPGYVSGNFPITGWSASVATGTGINPVLDGRSPFANTGAIPNGNQAAFIQADGGTLSQIVSGMLPGTTYYLKYYENARSGYPAPSLTVTLGGETIVPTHVVNPGSYVRMVSGPFLATADSAELSFIKTAGPTPGDSTVVIDSVAVLELGPSAPEFILQPQGNYLKEGQAFSLVSLAQGTLPMTYQWQKDGADLPTATESTLTFASIQLGDEGNYQAITSNQFGMATSAVAVVRVGLGLPALFNTGVDEAGAPLAGNLVDPHYQLVVSPDPAFPGPDAVTLLDQFPIDGTHYMSNGPLSVWISPMVNELNYPGNVEGIYTYRTRFVIDTFDPATVLIQGKWALDNTGWDVLLNGVSLGITNNTGFTVFSPFTITHGFQIGTNVLDFVTSNAPPTGPTAVRIELTGLARPLPPGLPQIVTQPQSQTVAELEDVTFWVFATGSPPLTYQWYYGEIDLLDETNRTLTLTQVMAGQAGDYRVVVTNPSGSITSAVARLSFGVEPILAGPDFIATAVDQPVSIPVGKLLFNDTDPGGDTLSITAVSPISTNGGAVALANDLVTYTPLAGYSGADQFTYTVGNTQGGIATGEVSVTVGATTFLSVARPPSFAGGQFHVTFSGVPGYPYTIESATDITGPWTVLTNLVADPSGLIELNDPVAEPAPSTRFYRTAYP